MSYSSFYLGGFENLPSNDTPITAEFLNALEAAMTAVHATADGAIPKPAGLAANEVVIWNGSAFDAIKLTTANLAAAAGITRAQLSGVFPIANADVDPAAAIAYAKLNLLASIVNADISGSAAIAYAKLALTNSIVNSDIASAAAIAYSKLNLAGAIVNADVATAAAILISKLAAGSAGQIISTVGSTPTWSDKRVTHPSVVTSLPGSPQDGDEIYFQADATMGIYWHLRYRSGSGSSFKWEFLGGPPMHAHVATSQTRTGATTYADLTTVGPAIALPLAGDYMITYGFSGNNDTANQGAYMAPDGAGLIAADGNAVRAPGGVPLVSVWREHRYDGLTQDTVTMKYKTTSAGSIATFSERMMLVRPVRV